MKQSLTIEEARKEAFTKFLEQTRSKDVLLAEQAFTAGYQAAVEKLLDLIQNIEDQKEFG